jgi:hypothetical protein
MDMNHVPSFSVGCMPRASVFLHFMHHNALNTGIGHSAINQNSIQALLYLGFWLFTLSGRFAAFSWKHQQSDALCVGQHTRSRALIAMTRGGCGQDLGTSLVARLPALSAPSNALACPADLSC